jgi:hypothetical protein
VVDDPGGVIEGVGPIGVESLHLLGSAEKIVTAYW